VGDKELKIGAPAFKVTYKIVATLGKCTQVCRSALFIVGKRGAREGEREREAGE